MLRPVFFVSDSTGITAETIGNSILAQFGEIPKVSYRLPFVDDEAKAQAACEQIRGVHRETGVRPIIVNTIGNLALSEIIAGSGGLILNVFAPFIAPLEQELGVPRTGTVNRSYRMSDYARYEARIDATHYALNHDDGQDVDYHQADLILLGVSRVGKTPTCLYMALHFGIRAANYPLTEEDLAAFELPARLAPYRERLFGLTIEPHRLAQIRQQRRPDSVYASLQQCRRELVQAERLMRREAIPWLNSTQVSIEEIASQILARQGIQRAMF